MAISVIGIPGRLIPAVLADRLFGPVNVFVFIVSGASLCLFTWIAVGSMPGLFAWVVVFGFFGAAIQSLFPATLAVLTKDLGKTGTRVGMLFTIISVAALTGAPLAGKLVQDAGGSYVGLQVWGGSSMMLGVVFLLAARWANNREKST
jgi:predicted MFS family arabinose efflux permease